MLLSGIPQTFSTRLIYATAETAPASFRQDKATVSTCREQARTLYPTQPDSPDILWATLAI